MIYEPAEDSFLLAREVEKVARGRRVLDVGCGSGIQSEVALKSGASEVLGVDVDSEAIEFCEKKGLKVLKSDLFEKVSGKFDLIVFNPPYLPEDSREDSESSLITSGGKKGDEIIVRFLRDVEKFLSDEGTVLLLVSSLTPLSEIEKVLREKNFVKRVVASEKIFMEELFVWEIRKD